MATIYTFGDSHASKLSGWGNITIPNTTIHTYHIGPKLMYSFGRDGLSLLNITDDRFNPRPTANDYVIYCFGEIDCRYHIHKYRPTFKDTIESMVEEYMKAIALNAGLVNGINTAVYNVVPTRNVKIQNTGVPKFLMSSEYPHLGSNEERIEYTLYTNECLKKRSREYGYLYFDVYDRYCGIDGCLNLELSDGTVHIRDGKYIEEFINNHMMS